MTAPSPPLHMVMPHRWETVFMVLVGVPMVVALCWSYRAWRRDGDVGPLVLMAAGTACCLLEPLVDVLGLCWYPRGQEVQAFDLMGRPIPLFVVLGYSMTFGGVALFATEVLRRRGPRALWSVWAGCIVFTSLFEFFAIHTGTYVYYGHQPLRVFGWPTWWGPVNALVAISIAVAVTRIRPLLPGWRILAVIPLVTMIDAAVNGAAAWPVYTVLWSHAAAGTTQVVGLLTWMLAAFGVWVMVSLAPDPSTPKRAAEPVMAIANPPSPIVRSVREPV